MKNFLLRAALTSVLLLAAAITLYISRFRMKGDGVSYLDLADAYLRADWAAAANTSWSPIYPLILAVFRAVFVPSAYLEIPLVHLTNFFIFCIALASFLWLINEITKAAGEISSSCILMAFALFTYCALNLIAVASVTPDMLLLSVITAITTVFLRIRREGLSCKRAVILGTLCGIGFLTKAVFLPLSLGFLALIALIYIRQEKIKVALVLAAFTVVALPFIGFLSISKQRFTFSDIGWINYCIDVRSCEGSEKPAPEGESNLILYRSKNTEATFPLWYDLAESRQQLKIRFDPGKQIDKTSKVVRRTIGILGGVFSLPLWIVIIVYAVVRRRLFFNAVGMTHPVLILAFGGIASYSLTHVENRYLAPMMIPLLTPFLIVTAVEKKTWLKYLTVGAALCLFLAVVYNLRGQIRKGVEPDRKQTVLAAAKANEVGLQEKDNIIVVGDGIRLYWARTARLRIVGEIPTAEAVDRQMSCDLNRTGVKAIVTNLSAPADTSEWIEIDADTKSYLRMTKCK